MIQILHCAVEKKKKTRATETIENNFHWNLWHVLRLPLTPSLLPKQKLCYQNNNIAHQRKNRKRTNFNGISIAHVSPLHFVFFLNVAHTLLCFVFLFFNKNKNLFTRSTDRNLNRLDFFLNWVTIFIHEFIFKLQSIYIISMMICMPIRLQTRRRSRKIIVKGMQYANR